MQKYCLNVLFRNLHVSKLYGLLPQYEGNRTQNKKFTLPLMPRTERFQATWYKKVLKLIINHMAWKKLFQAMWYSCYVVNKTPWTWQLETCLLCCVRIHWYCGSRPCNLLTCSEIEYVTMVTATPQRMWCIRHRMPSKLLTQRPDQYFRLTESTCFQPARVGARGRACLARSVPIRWHRNRTGLAGKVSI